MEEGKDSQQAIVAADADGLLRAFDVGTMVAMAEHHSFGESGAALEKMMVASESSFTLRGTSQRSEYEAGKQKRGSGVGDFQRGGISFARSSTSPCRAAAGLKNGRAVF